MFGIDITSCGILCKYHVNYMYKFSCLLLVFDTTFSSFTVASLPGSEVYTACWTVVGWRIPHSVWVLYTVWQELLMAKHSSLEHLQTFCENVFSVQHCEDHAHYNLQRQTELQSAVWDAVLLAKSVLATGSLKKALSLRNSLHCF